MARRKKSPKAARGHSKFRKLIASLPHAQGQLAKTDEALDLLEQLVRMQKKQYVISVRPSTNTTPL